ncbi:MAG: MotA/TolQ/ExbB proton channel family protein [Bacteroidales bacterium]|nr:MotA/TolQ/ExbB proton channel family protein [Bacteroidales bacterium]
METISNALFWISNGLLVPVVVLLLLFLVRALILVGGFFGEYYQRHALQKKVTTLLEGEVSAREAGLVELSARPEADKIPLLRAIRLLLAHRSDMAWCERMLSNYEVDAQRELASARTLAKLGPMLGLMGTLIPMGPALVGLAAGDLASMAYNMQVAFATTVVGMLIAAIGVIILQVRQRWYARELNDLEYIAQFVRDEKA